MQVQRHTMKTIYYLLALSLCLSYLGCSKEESATKIIPPAEGELRLDDLQIGQKSIYRHYTTSCESFNEIDFSGDRITVEVISQNGGLALKETLDPSSPSYYDGYEPVSYPIEPRDDHLFIPERQGSRLFFFYGNDKIMLSPVAEKELSQNNCFLMDGSTPFIGNSIAEVGRFNLQIVEELDQTVVSCVPNFEIDAYLLYDQYQLQASHTVSSSEFGGVVSTSVSGWSLVDVK